MARQQALGRAAATTVPKRHGRCHPPAAVPILGEGRIGADRVVHPQLDKPAKQRVVFQLLTKQSLTTDRGTAPSRAKRSVDAPAGIEGRPTSLYICSNNGESSLSAISANSLIEPDRTLGRYSLLEIHQGQHRRLWPIIYPASPSASSPSISLNCKDPKPVVNLVGEELFNILLVSRVINMLNNL